MWILKIGCIEKAKDFLFQVEFVRKKQNSSGYKIKAGYTFKKPGLSCDKRTHTVICMDLKLEISTSLYNYSYPNLNT